MLYVITGKQRAGKSYFSVTIMQDYLKSSNRPIYTNLPLHPDIICKGLFRSPAKYSLALRRIFLFKKFRSFGEAREFYKKNPDWCKLHQVIEEKKILRFWQVTQANAVIVLDELYQYFSSTDYRDKSDDTAERRRELLAYTRQHGHYKDDMFLISHSESDLDVNIRRGVQYLYVIRNAKYSNIFERFTWLKGLKWPVQFFIIRGYEHGDKEYSDSWSLFPRKHVFQCYDSFSRAESVPGKSLPDENATSTDTGTNVLKNLLHFVSCLWLPLAFVSCMVIGGCVGWNEYLKFVKGQKVEISTGAGGKQIKKLPEKTVEQVQQEKQPVLYYSPLAVSPNRLVYPNGIVLKIGDVYEDEKIVRFDRRFVYFVGGGRCSLSSFVRVPAAGSAGTAGTAAGKQP
ncbi:zonular occludens toxin domain-containing protein [Victivallis vadensis]|uniref:Zonular occludens toxin Zot n=2 Tax=Victivallis vadensis TaxID=172901 RepID=A0A2U1A8D5_9BACT|nr:zonular occludens toxin domain-containing protein [Victivallis vadensis]PVY29079.1 zonular occludens toxin Zot [Victivallis vadensis]